MSYWSPPSHCCGTVSWEPSFGGSVPHDAVHAGTDQDGGPIYVGRARFEGNTLPAKVCPNHGCAYISYDGREHSMSEYEVLKSSHTAWKNTFGANIPPEAIKAGETREGEGLYVGRVLLEGTLTVGKVHPSHGVLYVSWAGEERSFHEYEILVLC